MLYSRVHQSSWEGIQTKRRSLYLIVRPRGWHLTEKHILIDGEVASGSLVDWFILLPQSRASQEDQLRNLSLLTENHQEAKLWNDVFVMAQKYVGKPIGSTATILIEHILLLR